MKRTFALILASLLVTLCSSPADDTNVVSAVMDFEGVPPSQVLAIYEKISGLQVIVDSRVKRVDSRITLRLVGAPPPPKEEVLRQMRAAFLKQAGIVITRLDAKRESVTFNDALPIIQ